MELYQLKSFVAVAEEGNLTRAAERLFVSQPAVSGHLKALEAELGVRLFRRSPKGMVLTTDGEKLRTRALAVLAGVDEMMRQAQALKDQVSGPFRLGLNTDSAYLRISELFRGVHDAHPGIELELVQSNSNAIIDDLKTGRLDGGFALMHAQDEALETVRLEEVGTYITGPAAWADRIRGATLAELAEMPWIWIRLDCPCNSLAMKLFDARGLKPRVVAVTDSDATRRELVVSGTGLALMHELEMRPLLDQGKIAVWEGESLQLWSCYAWSASRGDDPLVAAVRECVISIWHGDGEC